MCRYGGEEFTAILPQTSINGAKIALDKLRQETANTKFNFEEKIIPVTISIGLVEYEQNQTIDEVMANADKGLYHAKETGRNKLVCVPFEDGVFEKTRISTLNKYYSNRN